jgi:hypothetical protein
VIVAVSQCMRGHVELNTYALGRRLQEIGVIGAGDTTTETVVAKLSYLLSWPDATPELVRHYMLQSLRGELTEDVHGTALSATNAWTSLTRTERGDMLFTGLGRQNIASEYQAGSALDGGGRALSPLREAKSAAPAQASPTPPPRKAVPAPSADTGAAARAMDAPPIVSPRAPAPPPAQTLTPVPPTPRPPPRVAPATAAAVAAPQRKAEEDAARAAAAAAAALQQRRVEEEAARVAAAAAAARAAAEEMARAADAARRRAEEERAAELQRKRDRMLAAEAEIAAAEAREAAVEEARAAAAAAATVAVSTTAAVASGSAASVAQEAAVERPQTRPCATCGKAGATFDCGGCRSVAYCSAECQQRDWATHEAVCGEPDE